MHPAAEVVTIGAEILKGHVLNTNAQFLGRELTGLGFEVRFHVVCADTQAAIGGALAQALERADAIFLCGGLGPTPDDVTREAVASYFRVPLVFSRHQHDEIRRHYYASGRRVPAMVRREAQFPQNAKPLLNRFGIALGFYIHQDSRLVIVLPGVPSELENMFLRSVKGLLKRFFPHMSRKQGLTVKTVGLSEPEIMRRLGKDFFSEPFEFGIYPDFGEVSIRIQAERGGLRRRLLGKIRRRLGPVVYAYEDRTLAETVGALLIQRGRTIGLAESCTGGRLASEITKVPGASRYFKGAWVAYGNEVKAQALGVAPKALSLQGAVSKGVALALARGARTKFRVSYGIGITGIAGPAGGSLQKPVGTVFIALATPKSSRVWRHHFWGERYQVQVKAARKALEVLWKELIRG